MQFVVVNKPTTVNIFILHSLLSRDFSPNLKQDLSGLSGFFRQLRSKSCFKKSGLSGFSTVYVKKSRSKTAQNLNGFERFIYKNRSKTAQDLNGFERFI